MAHQIGDSFPLLLRQPRIGKKGPHQWSAFLLLMLTDGVSVFPAAQRAGNVMGDGGDLQCGLRFLLQPFQLTDGFGVGPHADQMVDIMEIAAGIRNHFLQNLSNGHSKRSPFPFLYRQQAASRCHRLKRRRASSRRAGTRRTIRRGMISPTHTASTIMDQPGCHTPRK